MTLLLNVAHSTRWYAMMKLIAASLSLALFASGAWAQSLKEKYELSEQAAEHFEGPSKIECITSRGHGISRAIRLRHQHRKRPSSAREKSKKNGEL